MQYHAMRCDAMSYIHAENHSYIPVQTARYPAKSTVSRTQTGKRIGAVSAVLQPTNVHTLLAHVGFPKRVGYRRGTSGCLHAHGAEASLLLLRLLLLKLELLLLLLLLLLEWLLLQVKICLRGRGRRRGSHKWVPRAAGQHACGL